MLDRVKPSPGLGHRERGQTVLSGDVLELDRRLDETFLRWAGCWGADEYRFPACVEARHLDRLDYFRSFPHLATFPTTLDDADGNLEKFSRGEPLRDDGSVALTSVSEVDHVLTPAACYHVYIELEGEELVAPRYITTRATCFRSESSYTPLERQWNFSMREIVCIGTAAEVESFLERTTRVIREFIARITLPVTWHNATDPFFSPGNNPKFLFQKLEPVKRELVFGDRLAIASTNFHRDYFGDAFDIRRGDGAAFSGCVAFGMERWVAAFLSHYGRAPEGWSFLRELDQ
jgi:seryl-tRNA synthetase